MEQVKRFARDISWVFLSSSLTLLLGFVTNIFLARWLGAANLGLYRMVTTIQGIAFLAITFGLPAALIKYVAESRHKAPAVNQIVTAGLLASLGFGFGTSLLLYLGSPWLARIFRLPDLTGLLRLIALVLPFTSLFQALTGTLNGLRRMKDYALLISLQSCLVMLLVIGLAVTWPGVKGAVLGLASASILSCLVGFWLYRQTWHFDLHDLKENLHRLVGFGSQLFGTNTINIVVNQADIILIGYFLSMVEVGLYSVALALSQLLTLIPKAVQTTTYPATSEYWSRQDHKALQKMFSQSTRYSLCLLMPLGLALGFFAPPIIGLMYGQQYLAAAGPFCILLVARIIKGGLVVPIGGALPGAGLPHLALRIETVTALINVSLNIFCITRWGILGAAGATTISLLLGSALALFFIQRQLRVRFDWLWYGQVIGTAALAVALFLFGPARFGHPGYAAVILAIYATLVWRVFLTAEDRTIWRDLVMSVRLKK